MGMPLSSPVFAILAGLIEERSGMHYGLDQRDLLAEKVSDRALECGFDSLLDYYYYLRYDAESEAEMNCLIETLVVNETYFFRESDSLRVLIERVVRPVVARGERARIWSAACSTGEEPLTLAMMLAEQGLLPKVTLMATDISTKALNHAQNGDYGRRAMRVLPEGVADRYLKIEGDRARVLPRLREAIEFRQVNLLDTDTVAALGEFHAIACRNVLIYFGEEVTQRVVGNLTKALATGGLLLVGAAESLLRFGTTLRCEEHGGCFFYSRRA